MRTVFLPFVSTPKPTISVTVACIEGPKGSFTRFNRVLGVVSNPNSRAISDVQVSITVYGVTSTVMEVVSTVVQPGTVLPNGVGLFNARFGSRPRQEGCLTFGRIDTQLTSWREVNNTNVRPLTVIGTSCTGCVTGETEFLHIGVRNDQAVSLTQGTVTVQGYFAVAELALTQTLAPHETTTVTFVSYILGVYTDHIIAQGQIYP